MERIITYDLKHGSPDDYRDLYKVLQDLNGKQLTESTYVIDTPLSQKEIAEKLKKAIYHGDVLYYISVESETHKLFYNRILSA